MNKQKKQTIIIAIVVVLLVGIYFLIDKWPKKPETPQEPSEKLVVLDADQIIYLDFKGSDEQLTFTRESASGTWVLQNYTDREVDSSTLTSVLNASCNLTVQQKLENITDYSQFGFDEPGNIVTIKTSSETHTITFGSYNSAGSVIYVMVDSDKTIYVLSSGTNSIPTSFATEHYLVPLPSEDSEAEGTEGTNN